MSRNPKKNSLVREIWDLLVSTEFAIVLLILLAVASLLGIGIEEYLRRTLPAYQSPAEALGPWKYFWFSRLGLLRPYSSWWYTTLLGLLGFSLFACSVKRLKATVRAAFTLDRSKPLEAIARLPQNGELHLHDPPEQAISRIRDLLRKRWYRTRDSRQGSGCSLAAYKGAIGRLGPLFTHLGIVAILLGGIVAARSGYSVIQYAQAGELLDVPRRTFKVRVHSLWMEVTDDGHVKDWRSKLTVLDPDSVASQVVEVNHPLKYQGIAFYQASWHEDQRRIQRAHLTLIATDTGTEREVSAPFQEPVALGDGTFLVVREFVTSSLPDQGDNSQGYYRDLDSQAILLEVSRSGEVLARSWLFLGHPAMPLDSQGTLDIQWLAYEPTYITGIQIADRPGSSMIWTGIGLATLGVCLAFLVVHRRIWVVVLPNASGQARVVLGGNAHKSPSSFGREFVALVHAIECGDRPQQGSHAKR